jgi:predicted Zn-dependent protease
MLKRLIIIVVLLFPALLEAQDIDQLILDNKYDQALQAIDAELIRDKARPLLYLKKGIILQRQFDYSGAIKALEKGYRLDSFNINILNELAEANSSLGNFQLALPYYKALYSTDTTNLVNAMKLARAWFNQRSYREPFEILQSAYKRDSTKVFINKQLAFSASRSGHDSLAIVLYNKVIDMNPTDLNNYTNLANLYQKKENYLKVVETLENGLKVFPEETTLLLKLGDAHFSQRQYSKAINPYEVYLSKGDSSPDVLKNLGISYYYEKCPEEGAFLLEKYLTMKPDDPISALFIGLCYKDLKDFKESIDYLNFAAKIAIPYYLSDIYQQQGILYGLTRNFRKSIEAYKKAYTLDSAKCDLLFRIATTYEEFQKDKSLAINYYNAYLKAPKEDNKYHRELAEYALERKKKIKEYQLIYGKKPGN